MGGIDKKPRLFSVDMLGGVTEENMTATGSGSPIAFGVLEELFEEKNTISNNLTLAAKSVHAAMRRDAGSGERIDLVTVTSKGFERIGKSEVEKILKPHPTPSK